MDDPLSQTAGERIDSLRGLDEKSEQPDNDGSVGLADAIRQKAGLDTKVWVPYQGPEGGEGWQDLDGNVRYTSDPPGDTLDPADLDAGDVADMSDEEFDTLLESVATMTDDPGGFAEDLAKEVGMDARDDGVVDAVKDDPDAIRRAAEGRGADLGGDDGGGGGAASEPVDPDSVYSFQEAESAIMEDLGDDAMEQFAEEVRDNLNQFPDYDLPPVGEMTPEESGDLMSAANDAGDMVLDPAIEAVNDEHAGGGDGGDGGDGGGGGTAGFDTSFEEGDTIRISDDVGNERNVKVEDVDENGVRVDLDTGTYGDSDVRNLNPDEWSVEENVSADSGDDVDQNAGFGEKAETGDIDHSQVYNIVADAYDVTPDEAEEALHDAFGVDGKSGDPDTDEKADFGGADDPAASLIRKARASTNKRYRSE